MKDLETRFHQALDFDQYLDTVKKNEQLWRGVYQHAQVPADLSEEAQELTGAWHLLALSEDWCGDAVNILPVVAVFAQSAPSIELKILPRDQNLDIMDAHLTNGQSRSIPIVIVYDEQFSERAWWGPRPTPIQDWVMAEGLKMEKGERYKKVRQYYARDKGRTIVRELLDTLHSAAQFEVLS